jgi:hypothetical protein
MYSRDIFCILSRYTTISRQLARSERGYEGRGTIETSVTVCCIAGDQFIGVTAPSETVTAD